MRFAVAAGILAMLAAGASPRVVRRNRGHELLLPVSVLNALQKFDPTFRPWNDSDYDPELLASLAAESSSAAAFAVVGDFNGDGRRDVAIHGRTRRARVIVAAVSAADGSYRIHEIARYPLRATALCPDGVTGSCRLEDYVSLTPRGAHFTGAFEGYPLTLQHDAFEIVYFEKASVLYYWKGGRFHQYVTGD